MKAEYEAHSRSRPFDLEVHMEYGSLGTGRTVDPNTENEDKSGDAESSQQQLHGDQNPNMDVTYYRKKLVKIN